MLDRDWRVAVEEEATCLSGLGNGAEGSGRSLPLPFRREVGVGMSDAGVRDESRVDSSGVSGLVGVKMASAAAAASAAVPVAGVSSCFCSVGAVLMGSLRRCRAAIEVSPVSKA